MWGTVVTSSDLFNKAPKLACKNSMIHCYSTKPDRPYSSVDSGRVRAAAQAGLHAIKTAVCRCFY
ncbi:hypothetical protein EXD76_04165 [BEV proteobacterium]|nr:hypothetical protein [Candidatus Symbiopectobacterium sp. Chty_BC]